MIDVMNDEQIKEHIKNRPETNSSVKTQTNGEK